MAVSQSTRLYRVVLDTYMVGDLLRGRVEWRARSGPRSQGARDLVFGEPGDVYASLRHEAPGSWHALFIAPFIIERASAELGVRGRVHFRSEQSRDAVLSRALARFHRAFAQGEPGLERDIHLATCVRRLVEHHAERGQSGGARPALRDEPRSVRRAREYLHAHAASAVPLDDLAVAAGVSKYHLARSFRRVVGVPPHAYQVLLRVSLARRLISAGHSLGDVALATGFAAQSHLNRHFTRVVGVTPGAYRRAGMTGGQQRAQDR